MSNLLQTSWPWPYSTVDQVCILQADQAVEVCDESKVVQYVNRAYESVTGCLRGEVVGELSFFSKFFFHLFLRF
ncbi:unnamed protein product [Haemonchus placei]|uniref:PAS domain-containing protein n=1 Tax=Haemonchus placei TaxID=6290 RepID=A0A0N4W2T4_HAEPC|nr:unnamed protein product [Haemonchus placei]